MLYTFGVEIVEAPVLNFIKQNCKEKSLQRKTKINTCAHVQPLEKNNLSDIIKIQLFCCVIRERC